MSRATRGERLGPWLFLIALLASCEGGDDPDGNPDGGGDAGHLAPATCVWNSSLPELTLPTSQVKGVLRGQSRNASTTCTRQKGAGGPEALYVLRVATPMVFDLEVSSDIDTVLAIRRDCDDPLTEVACNDDAVGFDPNTGGSGGNGGSGGRPGIGGSSGSGSGGVATTPAGSPGQPTADAGASVPITSGRDAHLRAALEPGVYFVLVDEAEPHGVGGAFTLKVAASAPPVQARCSGGLPVTDGTRLISEQLDVASKAPPACDGGSPRAALYYTARIPSGQRLTARAVATHGDRAWVPVMQLLSACEASACLGSDRPSDGNDSERVLRYVNNGPAEQTVILAISASTAVTGGLFQLDVSIGEPIQNTSCESARTVTDGQTLLNQDLSEGAVSALGAGCKPSGTPSLFYRVTLLPRQRVLAIATARGGFGMGRPGLFMLSRESCSDQNCTGGFSDRVDVTNTTGVTKTLIIEVSTLPTGFPTQTTIFDLKVELPLPPGGVSPTPTLGLVTSEAGATASFDVVLDSPATDVVTIPLTSSNPKEGTVSPASLRFEPGTWNKPQRVTVTGVNDDLKDGNRIYQVLLGPATSGDPRYQGLDPGDVELTNTDDEPGFTFAAPRPVVTSEAALPTTFTVALNRAPTATVRLPLKSSNVAEGKVMPAELVFEPATWATPQVATVTGVDDAAFDGAQAYKIIVGPATSTDAQYAGVDPEDLDARNQENDFLAVEAKPVSGSLSCPFGGQDQRIGADEAGGIYVLMSCNGGGGSTGTGGAGSTGAGGAGGVSGSKPMDPVAPIVPPAGMVPTAFAAVSIDGGKTFSTPVNTGMPAFEMYVVGLSPGVAIAAGNGPQGLIVTRTETAGVSWESPRVLFTQTGFLRLAAAGKRVVLAARPSGGIQFLLSNDAGRSFVESKTVMSDRENLLGLGVDPTGTVWMAAFTDTGMVLRKSSDGGMTFDAGASLPNDFFADSVTFGPTSAFATGKDPRLVVAPLDKPLEVRKVLGLGELQMFPRVLVADRADGVTVLDSGGSFGGELVARHLVAGATSFSAPVPIGASNGLPGGVALGEKAVAVTLLRGDQVFVGVTTF